MTTFQYNPNHDDLNARTARLRTDARRAPVAPKQGEEPINDPLKQPAFAVEMPGTPQQNAKEIQNISPEGMPADPKAGPGALYRYIGLGVALLVVLALALVPFLGWAAAMMALAFAVLAMAINPSVVNTFRRADERRRVLERRDHPHSHPRP